MYARNFCFHMQKRAAFFQRRLLSLILNTGYLSCDGIWASCAKAFTKSSSFITSCLSEPIRRTVTVRFSFSLAPTTAITGILATECSRPEFWQRNVRESYN